LEIRSDGAGSHYCVRITRINSLFGDEKLRPISERKLDLHLVVRKSGSRQRYTRISRVKEGKRKIEEGFRWLGTRERGPTHPCRELRRKETISSRGIGERKGVTDHTVVTILLGRRHSEGSPEVKVVVIEAGSNEVVKSDAALFDEIVHKITGPSALFIVGKLDLRELDAEPSLEKVITGT
jgi:hypothetical protein